MAWWQTFHLLRPWWLLALVPALWLALVLWRRRGSAAGWRRAIPAELLEHLLDRGAERGSRWPWLALLAGWTLAVLALAGPTWEKLPQPVLQQRDALVIVLDLSLSMRAEDIKPSRLLRARYKILDILEQRKEGLTGLVAYAGDAHVVAPLTDDSATVANLVPALSPEMMPLYGSDPVAAVRLALQLLDNAGSQRGRVLLVSDGIDDADAAEIAALIRKGDRQLSVLGVGTAQGAPIPLDGGFLKRKDGGIVIPTLSRAQFEALAQRSGGRYSEVRLDDADLTVLLPKALQDRSDVREVEREFDQWRERGPWLAMLLLPLAALGFRRGWLLTLSLLVLLPLSPGAEALEWNDLWRRPDQQAADALAAGDAATAAAKFRDPAWRGSAQYRAGDYTAAAQSFGGLDSADADYNRGNALARSGKLQEAIAAYDEALAQNPALEDAAANKALLEQLLQQQQNAGGQGQNQQQNQGQNQQQGQNQSGQDGQQNQQSNDAAQNGESSGEGQPQGQPEDNPGEPGGDQARQNTDQRDASREQAGENQTGDDDKTAESAQRQRAQREAGDAKTEAAAGEQTDAEQRREQATEQWLRQIPDDPSGLLRRKFEYEHRQRARRGDTRAGEQPMW